MTFKPMTYLISFTLFVLLFMGLGGYVGYHKLADHFLTQSFLDARAMHAQVLMDAQGPMLVWEDRILLPQGLTASVAASNRPRPILIQYSDEPAPTANGIPLDTQERTEDIRMDPAGRYLCARVSAASKFKPEEVTWLYKYDLQRRKILRRTAVNPALLPALFKP